MPSGLILYKNDITKLHQLIASHTKTFVLLDEKSNQYCLTVLQKLGIINDTFVKIVIPAGESNKNIDTVQYIWSQLIDNHADRDSLLINVGGGMVTDIGGFAASCYQRGIAFINVPTTLLGMIDAAVGGKNGIDFKGLKNQIGVFAQPEAVLVLFDFLDTLPKRELLSGLAEIIKYGFISDPMFFEAALPVEHEYIVKAIKLKDEITTGDSNEHGLRKILNFGHTIGHALETYLMNTPKAIKHGEGVALGMISALYISEKYCNLDHKWILYYKKLYAKIFNRISLRDLSVEDLLDIMRHDKKNQGGDIRFVLVSEPGKPVYDVAVNENDIIDSVIYLTDYLEDDNYWN